MCEKIYCEMVRLASEECVEKVCFRLRLNRGDTTLGRWKGAGGIREKEYPKMVLRQRKNGE